MAFVDWQESHRTEVAQALATMSPSSVVSWYGAHKVPSAVNVASDEGGETLFWIVNVTDQEMALDGGAPIHVSYDLTCWMLHSPRSPRALQVADIVDGGLGSLGSQWQVMSEEYLFEDTPGTFNDMQFNLLKVPLHRSE